MNKVKNKSTDRLFNAILNLSSIDECYAFFSDLCTIKEILNMSQRLEVAIALTEGKNYHDIADSTGVSPATISRVYRCLEFGNDGYKLVVNKIMNEESQNAL